MRGAAAQRWSFRDFLGGILGRHPVRGEVDSQALATGAWPSQVVFAALLKFSWFCGGLLCKLYHSREYIPRPKQARANELIAEGVCDQKEAILL